MKNIFFLLIFLNLMFFLSSCSNKIICNSPYIIYGNQCCIDQNFNSICDFDEKNQEKAIEDKEQKVICNPPYIIKKNDCCLDKNSNSICDSDEIISEENKSENKNDPIKKIDETSLINKLKESVVSINVTAMKPYLIDNTDLVYREVLLYGAGFITNQSGIIVTNFHLIQDYLFFCDKIDSCKIQAKTEDNNIYNVDILSMDYEWDIAILKIRNSTKSFNYLNISEDSGKIGDTVYVIGSPMGNDFSVSKGIISAKNRDSLIKEGNKSFSKYMQIDAAVNPGNSGGPILNEKGEVIGVSSFGYKYLEGLNFGLQSEEVKKILDSAYIEMNEFSKYFERQKIKTKTEFNLFLETLNLYPQIKEDIATIKSFNFSKIILSNIECEAVFYTKSQNFKQRIAFNIQNKMNTSETICFKTTLVSNNGLISVDERINIEFEIKPGSISKFNEEFNIKLDSNRPHFYKTTIFGCSSGLTYAVMYGPSRLR